MARPDARVRWPRPCHHTRRAACRCHCNVIVRIAARGACRRAVSDPGVVTGGDRWHQPHTQHQPHPRAHPTAGAVGADGILTLRRAHQPDGDSLRHGGHRGARGPPDRRGGRLDRRSDPHRASPRRSGRAERPARGLEPRGAGVRGAGAAAACRPPGGALERATLRPGHVPRIRRGDALPARAAARPHARRRELGAAGRWRVGAHDRVHQDADGDDAPDPDLEPGGHGRRPAGQPRRGAGDPACRRRSERIDGTETERRRVGDRWGGDAQRPVRRWSKPRARCGSRPRGPCAS